MSIFRNLQNKLLDGSIFFSFDRSGFIRHAQEYNTEDLNVDCTGKNYLITGANSGLGKATAIEIAQRGGTVYLYVEMNSAQPTRKKRSSKRHRIKNIHVELIDMSDLHNVESAAKRLQTIQIDVLINNAGVLPTERWESKQGYEGICNQYSWGTATHKATVSGTTIQSAIKNHLGDQWRNVSNLIEPQSTHQSKGTV